MSEKPYRVGVSTILGGEPFYYGFDDSALAMAFITEVRKRGLRVGTALFMPKSITCISLQGLIDGQEQLRLIPQPAETTGKVVLRDVN